MDETKEAKQPRSRVKKGKNSINFITIAVILLFVISLFFFLRMQASAPNTSSGTTAQLPKTAQTADMHSQSETSVDTAEKIKPNKPHSSSQDLSPSEASSAKDPLPDNVVNRETVTGQEEQLLTADSNQKETVEELDSSTSLLPAETGRAKQEQLEQIELIEQINSFYRHLDQQSYIKKLALKEPSKVYFSTLLQKLVDHPPVVVRETDDLFTLLQNTAHFFRVLGKNNINTLKSILANEHDSFEQTLQAFYSLSSNPELLKEEYSVSLTPGVLIDYASFFLNTMGGRLYLFRRDSTSRMIVSYYAIMTIHRANQAGDGAHGIDLRPAIKNLVDDLEDGGRRMQLKEQYLDVLYDLQEIYN